MDELLHKGAREVCNQGNLKLNVDFEITPEGGLVPEATELRKPRPHSGNSASTITCNRGEGNVQAQTTRVQVKRILRKYGYPPDRQEKATETVLEQAAVLSAEWAAA